jgi:tetratricopeptide (TPR) repeat protein
MPPKLTRSTRFVTRFLLSVVLGAALTGTAVAQGCGSLVNGFGPFDYRTAGDATRKQVELHHFNANVENLRTGQNGYLAGDIDYVLRAFPNHPRALWSMEKLARRERTEKPLGATQTASCYFHRAIEFQPDDATVRLLFALHLIERGKKPTALEQLQTARGLVEEDVYLRSDGNVAYNLGLGFYQVGHYDEALQYAKRADALGFPMTGLQSMLKRAGKWK